MRKAPVSPALVGKFAAREIPGPQSRPLVRKGARIDEQLVSSMRRQG